MTNTMLTLLSAERLHEHYRDGFWRDDTIYSLARGHAQRAPGRFAMRNRFRRIGFGALVAAADALAADLHVRGLRRGERVMVWLPSRIETAVALLACSRNGYICCPSLHRDHTVREISKLMEATRAAALIGETGYGADSDRRDIFEMVKDLPSLRHAYRLAPADEATEALAPFAGLLGEASGQAAVNEDPNRVVYLAYTSGTTGQPKGVMHSDNTLLSNARVLAADWNITDQTVIYTMSPLSHNLGMGALIAGLAMGSELVVHDLLRRQSVLDRLIETGATFLYGVPTHAIDLLDDLRKRKLKAMGAIKGFRMSGAAAPREVVAELLRYGITPQTGYGMTETCSHQYTRPDDDPQLIIETSGRSCPGYEIRIFRDDDKDVELPIGETGEIGGKGASLMLGYFNDQANTEDSFNSTGWFMTGDLGWVDERGYLRITGRKKDIINRGGHKIFPARIEALVMRHPGVERAAAFPVKDARLGEKVSLAVMLKRGVEISAEEMLAHLAEAGLSRYDMPEYYLELGEIPLTSSGKINKRELVVRTEEGRIVPMPVRWLGKQG